LIYAGGSSSSDANAFDFAGNIDDWVEERNCRGSCLSSIVCPAAMEAAICLDLVTIYSVTADLGKKITSVRADEIQHPNAPIIARKSVQNMLSFTWWWGRTPSAPRIKKAPVNMRRKITRNR